MATPVKIPAEVINLTKHTEKIVSYSFRPLKRVPKFKPGQFLHLTLENYDPSNQWPESRVFSIESSPSRKDEIKITIVVKGEYTRRIYNEIKKGDAVWLKLPYGDFTFENETTGTQVLIAGGTGITPFVSYLELCLDNNIHKNIKLYYGVREQGLIIFNFLIESCIHNIIGFSAVIYIGHLSKIN